MGKHREAAATIITDARSVVQVSARIYEMAALLRATRAETATVEYSALIGLAVQTMAVAHGMPLDDRTLSRLGRLLFSRLAPIIEEVINDFKG